MKNFNERCAKEVVLGSGTCIGLGTSEQNFAYELESPSTSLSYLDLLSGAL
jgi:hypothetical protein